MSKVIELLTGYPDPDVHFVGVSPFGTTGLGIRIYSITMLRAVYESLTRRQTHRFCVDHSFRMFPLFLDTTKECWLSEILRIMDAPAFGSGAKARPNLTLPRLQEEFIADPTYTAAQKQAATLEYDAMMSLYLLGEWKTARNRSVFHLDLEAALKKPLTGKGDMYNMTDAIVRWFTIVSTAVCGTEPGGWTRAGTVEGRKTAKETRRTIARSTRYAL